MNNGKCILLVEDDKVDAMTVKRALKDLSIKNNLIVCKDGEEALFWLKSNKNNLPGIILLDLNMPKMNGFEFLKEAKNDQRLRLIPVVVLTTSKEQCDKEESYSLNASGYMIKPLDYSEFVNTMSVIQGYWNNSKLAY